MQLRLAVELPPQDAALSAHSAPAHIHVNALHRRQIDHQALIDRGPPRDIVTPAAHRHLEAERAGQVHGIDNVGDAMTGRNRGRTLVDQAVVHPAAVVVPGVGRPQQLAGERWSGERYGFSDR